MVKWLGGIQPDPEAVGFDRIVIRPQTPKGLDWVKSSYRSIRGKIVSDWRRQGRVVKFDVDIPANTRALICLPAKAIGAITEDGRPLARAVRSDGNSVEFTVGSGHYTFKVRSSLP
jgi:alpha-L-rhamnosidase